MCCAGERSRLFESKDMLEEVNKECPTILDHIIAIKDYEKETFLPDEVSELFKTMISIHAQVHKLAEKRRFIPKPYNGEEPPNEYYPSLPLRSLRPSYKSESTKKEFRRRL